MNTDFLYKRTNTIQNLKDKNPELNWLLHDISGLDGINEINILTERLKDFEVSKWSRGMNIEALVQHLVKYKSEYGREYKPLTE